MTRQPTVVIAANPYEAELCRRALADTGLAVEVAEGGDGLLDLVAAKRPLAVVVADGLFCGDMRELVHSVRDKHPMVPVFLIGDRGGDVPDEQAATWLGARRLFFRPVEVEKFADAVEKLAVEAELASEVSEQLEAVHAEEPAAEQEIEVEDGDIEEVEMEAEFEGEPKSLGRMQLKQLRRGPLQEPVVELPVRRAPTEVIVEPPRNGNGANGNVELNPPPASIVVPQPAPIPASSSAEGILRADEALSDEMMVMPMADLAPHAPMAAGGVVAATMAPSETTQYQERKFRRLDRELSAAERRLFPDSSGRAPVYDDYDDALGDIDLDSLGIDTMPGIGADALDAALERPRVPELVTPAPGQKVAAPRETPSGLHQLASQPRIAEAGDAAPPLDEEGTLGETDLAELLASLLAAGWTGRCVLARGDGEKSIFFDSGLPVSASSTMVSDRLGDLLYREGKITREQHARTRELTVEPGRRTAVLFVELGLIKSGELFPTLRRHAEEIIYSAFAWNDARYRLEREQPSPDDKLRLSVHPWALFMEGIRRKYGLERLVELVGPPETLLAPTTGLGRALGDCELSASERVAAELFDGERSLADIALALNGLPGVSLPESALYALAWGLLAVGAVRRQAEEGGERLGVRAISTLVAPISPERDRRARERMEADRPQDRAIDRERLLAKRTQVADCDYFAALGVAREASEHEIRRAYQRLRADFARDRYATDGELVEALDDVHQVLEEAFRVLSDPELRTSYRTNLLE